jgi:hypothetical protein
MDSHLVRKCPLSVITLRLNAELCNGHGTFPDKFSISAPSFPTHCGAGGAERSDAMGNAGGNAPLATKSNLSMTAADARRRNVTACPSKILK